MENDHGPCTVAPYDIASRIKEFNGPTYSDKMNY